MLIKNSPRTKCNKRGITVYKRAQKSKNESDIKEHKDFKRSMRREVSAAYKKFLDEMDALPAASAIQKTSKMAKALVRREKQNRSSGSPIEPEVFSTHIASICSSEEQWNGDMRRFVPQWY